MSHNFHFSMWMSFDALLVQNPLKRRISINYIMIYWKMTMLMMMIFMIMMNDNSNSYTTGILSILIMWGIWCKHCWPFKSKNCTVWILKFRFQNASWIPKSTKIAISWKWSLIIMMIYIINNPWYELIGSTIWSDFITWTCVGCLPHILYPMVSC